MELLTEDLRQRALCHGITRLD